jgi:hypothetical protein
MFVRHGNGLAFVQFIQCLKKAVGQGAILDAANVFHHTGTIVRLQCLNFSDDLRSCQITAYLLPMRLLVKRATCPAPKVFGAGRSPKFLGAFFRRSVQRNMKRWICLTP